MISSRSRKIITGSALALCLAACGGGSSNSPAVTINPPPIGSGPVVAAGPITGFGSTFVNGVRYDTSGAAVTKDGLPATESDLDVGHVVVLTGTVNDDGISGTAASIEYDENVEGPITSIGASSFVVLGQTVIVDALTFFDDSLSPADLTGLSIGNFVEVCGLITAAGDILATRVDLSGGTGELEIKGMIESLDTASMLFNINSQVVDYSGAMLNNFPSGIPGDDDLVDAKGSVTGAGGELIATSVEKRDSSISASSSSQIELHGFIRNFVSDVEFDVGTQPVTTDGQTQFKDGTITDLADDVRVEVEGRLIDVSGVMTLLAREIDFFKDNKIRIEATADTVNVPDPIDDPTTGTVTMLGVITVNVNMSTRVEDDLSNMRPFNLSNVNDGDFLEIRGFEDPPGAPPTITASRLERDDFDPDVILQGFAESVSDPTYVTLGVTVETNSSTQFEDENDNLITSNDFFTMAPGRLVKAKGAFNAGVLTAEEVELQD